MDVLSWVALLLFVRAYSDCCITMDLVSEQGVSSLRLTDAVVSVLLQDGCCKVLPFIRLVERNMSMVYFGLKTSAITIL